MATLGPMSATRSKPPPLSIGEGRPTRINTRVEDDSFEAEKKELKGSLEAGWIAARERFQELTGDDLNAFRDGKVGVLNRIEGLMSAGDRDIKKHQNHMATVEKVLNCVEFVGSVAAQGVSIVFSQASLCFSAIEMLINVPKMYKHLVDGLQELFSNINEFFPKLKIFQRTDYKLGLDSALVQKLNEILIALVDTCAVAIKVRKHKMIAVAKILFLKDDKIQDAITGFKNKIAQLDSLTAPVTLEKILETRNISLDSNRRLIGIEATGRETSENVKEVRMDVKEMSTGVKELLYLNAEGRNLKADQEKIEKIDKALFVTKEAVAESLRTLESCHETMLEGTVKVLGQQSCFDPERSPYRPIPILLEGNRGTGRTYYLAGLVKAVSLKIHPIFTGDSKPIWAYYSFSDRNLNEATKQSLPFRKALGLMACQIARQSSAYTRLLQKDIDNISQAKDVKEFLSKLRFQDLLEQENCSLYLIFDGLDHLRGDLTGLDDVLELTSYSVTARSWPQIVLAAEDNTFRNVKLMNYNTIRTKYMNSSLLREFIEDRTTILQEESEKDERRRLVDKLLLVADSKFDVAQQKLDVVDKAVADDLDFSELLDRLSDAGSFFVTSQADQMLDAIFRDLSPNIRGQLKEILYWCSYSETAVKTDLLSSSLFLETRKKPLGTLEAKIRRNFGSILSVDNEKFVNITNSEIARHLRWLPRSTAAIELQKNRRDESSTSRQESGDSAQKILKAIAESISTGDFSSIQDMQIGQADLYQQPVFTSIEAHWTIACRCLQALNDDENRKEMQSLVQYAADELPEHLYCLDEGLGYLTVEQQRAIGQALVEFLSNAERVEAVMATTIFRSYAWFSNRMNIQAIGNILNNGKLKYELKASDRRTANRLVSCDDPDSIPFLEVFAIAAANLLFDEKKEADSSASNLFAIIRRYLGLIKKGSSIFCFASQATSLASTRRSSIQSIRSGREESVAEQNEDVPMESIASQDDKDNVVANGHMVNEEEPKEIVAPDHEDHSVTDSQMKQNSTSDEPILGFTSGNTDALSVVKLELISGADLTKATVSSIEHENHTIPRNPLNTAENTQQSSPARSRSQSPTRAASVTSSQTEEEDSIRVKDWALQKTGLTESWYTWLVLGEAVGARNATLEQTYFKQALESSTSAGIIAKCRTARALASSYANDKKWNEALSALSPAADALRQQMKSEQPSEELRKSFNEILEQLAEYMIQAKKDDEAIVVLREGLQQTPISGYHPYYLIRLLCSAKRMEAAQSVFDTWKSGSIQNSHDPGSYITTVLRRQTSGAILGLAGIFLSARGWPLLDYFEQCISDVVSQTQSDQQNEDRFLLHFARGLAWAVKREETAMKHAVESWYKCIDLLPKTSLDDTFVGVYCQRYLAQMEFDRARMQTRLLRLTERQSKELFADAANRIQRIFVDDGLYDADKCRSFAVVSLMFAGKVNAARALVKSNVAYAIELLTDEFDDNDTRGMWLLCRTMLLVREYEACHNAYSFFGRSTKETKFSSPIGAPQDSDTEMNTNADDSSKNGMDPVPADEVLSLANDYLFCSACDSRLYARGETEIWICKYCHEEDFCASCYGKLKEDKLGEFICSPDHDHLLLKHFNYEDEEIKEDNVRVGWKYEQGTDPRDRRRVGEGKIVDRKTWMEMLRKEWDIAAPVPFSSYFQEEIDKAEMEYMMYG